MRSSNHKSWAVAGLLSLALVLGVPAQALAAAFSVVVSPSTAFANSLVGQSAAFTANGNCSIGSQLIAVATENSTTGTLSVQDDDGSGLGANANSYTTDHAWTLNTHRQDAFHTTVAHAIVSGTSRFYVTTTVTGRASLIVFCATGAGTLDVIGTGIANGAGASSSTTHTPGSAASTLNVAFLWRNGAPTGFSEGAGWTTIQTVNNTSNNILTVAYQITTSASPLTYAPSWTGSVTSESATISYTGSGGAPAGPCLLAAVGAGKC